MNSLVMILMMAASYLIGSIPFGLIITRIWTGEDIRKYGSGNIGTSNVLRTVGVIPAILVLILDVSKGVAAAYLGGAIDSDFGRLLCGIAAIAGHNWSVFLKFKGGKGIATSAGVLFVVWPTIGLILVGLWVLVVAFSRYISLGSLVVAGTFPILLLIMGYEWKVVLAGLVLTIFAFSRHVSNFKRLLEGKEYKIGEKVKRQ